MTHYLKILSGFVVGGLLLIGCSEHDPPNPVSAVLLGSPPPGGIQFQAPEVPFNPSNPLDSMGLIHNEAFVYALQWITATTLEGNMDTLFSHFNQGLKEYYVSNNFLTDTQYDSVWTSAIQWCENNSAHMLDPTTLSTYEDAELSPLAVWYLHRIGDVLTSEEENPQVTIDSLSQIETGICAISWDSLSAFSVYSTISIAKYSFYLWHSIAESAQSLNGDEPVWSNQDVCTFTIYDTKEVVKYVNIDSQGHVTIVTETQFDIHSWWSWIKTAASDAWEWFTDFIGL